MSADWWRYFASQNRVANAAVAGEVSTLPGSGLEGGGPVADGLSLSIAPNGVENGMFRQSTGTSVIGRYQNSTGNVADVKATGDGQVLNREGGVLAFRSILDALTVVNFHINQAPVAETIVCTHTITISVNGVDYKIPIVAA